MARGALFDKDGTLIDFEATWFPLIRDVLEALETSYAVPGATVDRLREAGGVASSGFVRESLIQSGAASEIIGLWEGIVLSDGARLPPGGLAGLIDEASVSGRYPVRVARGAEALLSGLKERGYALGVVTGDSRPSAERTLKSAGLLDFFDFMAADGDGYPPKPDPAAAETFIDRFGVDRDSLTMVGDSEVDMLFARNAGARFLGMKTQCNDYTRFVMEGFPVVEDFLDPAASDALLG